LFTSQWAASKSRRCQVRLLRRFQTILVVATWHCANLLSDLIYRTPHTETSLSVSPWLGPRDCSLADRSACQLGQNQRFHSLVWSARRPPCPGTRHCPGATIPTSNKPLFTGAKDRSVPNRSCFEKDQRALNKRRPPPGVHSPAPAIN